MSTLLLVAILSDLLSPILIAKAGLPPAFRWLSQVALAAMMAIAYVRLLRHQRIPRAVWLVLLISITGSAVASLNGQSVVATAWGWWLMFRYPLVGLYVYLEPCWPARFPARLRVWCIRLLCFEVGVQLCQYLTGEVPGDGLAGTLGQGGTGDLALVVLWVLALSLGRWVSDGRLVSAGLVSGLGVISSVLGEMKVFFFAGALMLALAVAIQVCRSHRLWPALPATLVLGAGFVLFPWVYDAVVPGSQASPFVRYLDTQVSSSYLSEVSSVNGARETYYAGRNYALQYCWHRIGASPMSVAFGEGLGARGQSNTLGSEGVALLRGDLGQFTGSSLVVMMGELGITGLIALAGFLLAVLLRLWKATRTHHEPDTLALVCGLIIYTLMLPLWLWYTTAWSCPILMLLYWTSLSFALKQLSEPSPTMA